MAFFRTTEVKSSLGPVHSLDGPGPTIWVQVRLRLDLVPDIWVRSGSARSRTGPWTVYPYPYPYPQAWVRVPVTFLVGMGTGLETHGYEYGYMVFIILKNIY